MRNLWNVVCDPGLHLLAIALVLVGLAIGGGAYRQAEPEAPEWPARAVQVTFGPDKPDDGWPRRDMADARP